MPDSDQVPRESDVGLAVCVSEASVMIDKGSAKSNRIVLRFDNTRGERATVDATIVVAYDGDEALLANENVHVTAMRDPGAAPLDRDYDDKTVSWSAHRLDVDASDSFTLTLSEFEANTTPGQASVVARVESGGAQQETTFEIDKARASPVEPTIHYLTASPEFVLDPGNNERGRVKGEFSLTACRDVALFRNNKPLPKGSFELEPPAPGSDKVQRGRFTDYPSFTTEYRVEARSADPEMHSPHPRVAAVQVLARGWNSIAHRHGFPTQVFPGPGTDRMHAIFCDGEGRARLMASSTGLDDWTEAICEGPDDLGFGLDEMMFSPGVVAANALWLIGGSSIDANNPTNRVLRCDRLPDAGTTSQAPKFSLSAGPALPDEAPSGSFRGRTGHACVVVPIRSKSGIREEIWVIGGTTRVSQRNDTLKLDPEKGKWSRSGPHTSSDDERELPPLVGHSAVTVSLADGASEPTDGQECVAAEVWIHAIDKDARSAGIWKTRDGFKFEPCQDLKPSAGKVLANALLGIPRDDGGSRLFLAGTFVAEGSNIARSQLYEWGRGDFWLAQDVGRAWEMFEGDRFDLRATVFNRCVFVWALDANIDPKVPPRLAVLIPS